MKRFCLIFLFFFVLSACNSGSDILIEETSTDIPSFPTNTFTPLPTDTPTPTSTETPIPTPTIGIGSIEVNPKDGMAMVFIPAGEFEMGSGDEEDNEKPVHVVYLDAYWMYQTEVTNAMYAEFLNALGNQSEGGVTWLNSGDVDAKISEIGGEWTADSGYGEHPVIEVSWYGAQAYCEWAGGGLPTEAQWEKAARGGLEGMQYPWGDQYPVCDLRVVNGAQFGPCAGQTVPVGSFALNDYGLYDMAGNVWEWVADWYSSGYYDSSPHENPPGPSNGIYRALRGGSWKFNFIGYMRTAYRYFSFPVDSFNDIGFRCVLPLP